ncbi:fimbrial protein [Pseudomonas putida]
MNIKHAALVSGICALLTLPAAMAADGQIDFKGEVTGSTCNINGGNPDFDVLMPPVGVQALSQAGQTAGRTPFTIQLTECLPETGDVMTYFEPGPTVNPLTGRLTVDDGQDQVRNLEVGLLNDTHKPMDVSKGLGSQNSQVVALVGGAADLNYFAEYVATGMVSPGKVNTRILYSIAYP